MKNSKIPTSKLGAEKQGEKGKKSEFNTGIMNFKEFEVAKENNNKLIEQFKN